MKAVLQVALLWMLTIIVLLFSTWAAKTVMVGPSWGPYVAFGSLVLFVIVCTVALCYTITVYMGGPPELEIDP